MVQMGPPMGLQLALAALALTVKVCLALHTAPSNVVAAPATRQPGSNDSERVMLTKRKKNRVIAQDADLPPDLQAQFDEARASLGRAVTPLSAIDAHKVRSKKTEHDANLWLTGRSRQAMVNYGDVQYIAYIEVGNQTLTGIIDTGSFELVVFSKTCENCGQAAQYDPIKSPTHRNGKLVSGQSYGSGDTWSQEAYDLVSIGPYEARNQSFWEVTKARMPVLYNSAFQSIIGVGPPETPSEDAWDAYRSAQENATSYLGNGQEVPPDLKQLVEDKRTIATAMNNKNPMLNTFHTQLFSVCIGKQPKSDGYLIWSDTAPLVRPEYFKRVRVVGNHTWSAELTQPKLAFESGSSGPHELEGLDLGCEEGCGALMDSGTSLLALPAKAINKLVQAMQVQGFNCSNMWELPALSFRLGGHEFSLPPDVYVAETGGPVPSYLQSFVRVRNISPLAQRPGARCELLVMESYAKTAHGPLWILGLPFFRKYYTTFAVGGNSGKKRSLYVARASDSCTPASAGEDSPFPPRSELYRRTIDPSQLWVPSSIQSAIRSDFVSL